MAQWTHGSGFAVRDVVSKSCEFMISSSPGGCNHLDNISQRIWPLGLQCDGDLTTYQAMIFLSGWF